MRHLFNFLGILAAFASIPALADINGPARVIDGDTIEIAGQRSMIAARLANIQRDEIGRGREKLDSSIELSNAAALLNVSVSSLRRARKLLNEGKPEDIAAT